MIFSITIKSISNGYLVQFSDPSEVLFHDGGEETSFSEWYKIAPFIEHTLDKFKKKAK